jgi:hypothetical protein
VWIAKKLKSGCISEQRQVEMINPELWRYRVRGIIGCCAKNEITVRKTIDSLIATYCIENGHDLLHNDSDFDGYEKHLGLRV